MSCFFCNSSFHLSQNCDIYISDECRKVFTRLKNCCEICLTPLHPKHYIPDNSTLKKSPTKFRFFQKTPPPPICVPKSECAWNRRCYVCFSKFHHSVYCPERLKAPTLFLPNIDNNLMKRFMQMLDEFDQFLLASTYPKAFNLVPLKSFAFSYNRFLWYNYIVVYIGNYKFDLCHYNFVKFSFLPNFINKSSAVTLEPTSTKISSKYFLPLLTHNTKIMSCFRFSFLTPMPFEEILKRAPNIEIIEFAYTNIEMGKEWPENLLKYKNGNSFKKLNATIYDTDFNAKSLATFMSEKCIKNVEIILRFYILAEKFQSISEEFSQKLLKYFDPFISIDNNNNQIPHLTIFITEKHQHCLKNFKCLNFTLKRF